MHWISYYLSLLHSRAVYYLLIAVGSLQLFGAGRAEYTGVTSAPKGSRYGPSFEVSRQSNPDLFRRATSHKWIMGAMWLGAGLIIQGIHRWANRMDPFSEDYAGTASLRELEQKLDEELEDRNRLGKS